MKVNVPDIRNIELEPENDAEAAILKAICESGQRADVSRGHNSRGYGGKWRIKVGLSFEEPEVDEAAILKAISEPGPRTGVVRGHVGVTGHKCWGPWGHCDERDGIFEIHDGEYDNRVNFCPFCGAKAPKPITEEAGDGD